MAPENVERIRALVEPWTQGDFGPAIARLTPDVEMSAYLPEGVVVFEGREDVVRFMVEFGSQWKNYRVEVDDLTALSDDSVLVSGRQVGSGATSGLEIAEPVYIVLRLRGEQISGQYWHVDRDSALEAAGFERGHAAGR